MSVRRLPEKWNRGSMPDWSLPETSPKFHAWAKFVIRLWPCKAEDGRRRRDIGRFCLWHASVAIRFTGSAGEVSQGGTCKELAGEVENLICRKPVSVEKWRTHFVEGNNFVDKWKFSSLGNTFVQECWGFVHLENILHVEMENTRCGQLGLCGTYFAKNSVSAELDQWTYYLKDFSHVVCGSENLLFGRPVWYLVTSRHTVMLKIYSYRTYRKVAL